MEETPVEPIEIAPEYHTGMQYEPPVILPPISIDDLLQSIELVTKQEAEDKSRLESIGSISSQELKTKLVAWAVAGFPTVYQIHTVTITPPTTCSDGVVRSLTDYISFCSGKTISEHVAVLQEKVSNISISFANMGSHIAIVVSKV